MVYFIRDLKKSPQKVYLEEKPTEVFSFFSEVKIKDGFILRPGKGESRGVLGIALIPIENEETSVEVFPISTEPRNQTRVEILKSNLQKAVRRGNEKVAIATTLVLLHLSPQDLLRRLPIIIVEDSIPNASYALLVWLMVAVSKGYELTVKDVGMIIGIVKDTAREPFTIDYTSKDWSSTKIGSKNSKTEYPISEERSVIWSALSIRQMYGGTEGDMKMLERSKRLYGVWRVGYSDKLALSTLPKGKLRILPEAIDQHCAPGLITNVSKASGLDPEIVSSLVWNFRSSINFRNRLYGSKYEPTLDEEQEWEEIKELVETNAKRIANSYSFMIPFVEGEEE